MCTCGVRRKPTSPATFHKENYKEERMEDHHLQPDAAYENSVHTLADGVSDLLGGAEADYR